MKAEQSLRLPGEDREQNMPDSWPGNFKRASLTGQKMRG
jgi:hypothetical protein